MVVLSGERVSELERLSSCRPGDEFLISRHYNLSSDRLFSKRLKYESLVADTVDNLCMALHLSSAAFVEKTEYSRKNHGHDYSTVYVFARPLSAISAASGVNVYPDTTTPMAELSAFNKGSVKSVVVYSPGQQYAKVDDIPAIGELKFLARKQLWAIDVDAPDFNGWVYPDGAEYGKNDFPSAYALYGDGQSDTFKVPFLSNFIRLNPGVDKVDPMKKFPAVNEALAAHTHEISKNIIQESAGKITVNVKIPGNNEEDPEQVKPEQLLGAIHVVGTPMGEIAKTEYEVSNFRQSNISISGGKCAYAGIDRETTPNYNMLPVLIYIGKKAK